MTHATDGDLYRLAEQNGDSALYDDEDRLKMRHIGQCRKCYEKLCCFFIVTDIMGNKKLKNSRENRGCSEFKAEQSS